ncbi:MAG: class I SAM-dependent methyltransferase [Simkaniaceae bacterium]|nr:class I SAM-dependent methyltransferase [Simkaniaceae bacterium]
MRFFLLFLVIFMQVHSGEPSFKRKRDNYVYDLIKPNAIGLEIGVFQGTFAKNVLSQKDPKLLYLVDPWSYPPQTSKIYANNDVIEGQRKFEAYYENLVRHFSDNSHVKILRMTSLEAAEEFPNEYFDYIYIDGDHSYKGVMLDLTTYVPKVKKGGLIIGDDFGFQTVAKAVKEFVKKSKEIKLIETKEGQYLLRKL